jgi:hypothetical protein
MKTMKVEEALKYIADTKMPDIEQVRAKCLNQAVGVSAKIEPGIKARQRQPQKKLALIIAAIALFTFSVSAINVIQNLTFKGFEASQVYTLGSSHIENRELTATVSCDIKDRQVLKYRQEIGKYYASGQMDWVYFDTLEEAVQHLEYNPSGLNYIPENGVFDKVVLHGNPQSDFYDTHSCIIYYKSYQADGSPLSKIALSAVYVGKNATIKVDTTYNIEEITLSDGTKALLMSDEKTELLTVYWINWIKDGIAYETGGGFSRADIIKMAESVK